MHLPIEIKDLSHRYGNQVVYGGLSMSLEPGRVYGLLGKNGVGKTTLIKILMGFLRPESGECRVFGDPANRLRPATRARVGLLFERHLAYNFFSIAQIERFYSRFYPAWKPERFYGMVNRLGLPHSRRIANMSEGQRSQVVLGLILAQDPELLILDDYSMGLDAGYRRLFVDYLAEHFKDGKHTVVLTSHVIQDMESFVDEMIFLERGGAALRTSMREFRKNFRLFRLPRRPGGSGAAPRKGGGIKNVEEHPEYWDIFSFAGADEVASELAAQGANTNFQPVPMSLEDAFVGYTGRY